MTTTIVSVGRNGRKGNSASFNPSISEDGRYVAYTSFASNLVSGDTKEKQDIFVYDTQLKTTRRVSVASDGTESNYHSSDPSISGDGRYVAYSSRASNLVSGDTKEKQDIFVYDTQLKTTRRLSVASDGTQSNYPSQFPSISGDGRYVAYSSRASNLVSGDTNFNWDIFVYDTQLKTTRRVSVASDGTEGNDASDSPSISGDGRYVAYSSRATNLVSGDTNDQDDIFCDIFVYDTQLKTTRRVSVANDNTEGNSDRDSPSISGDGRYVAYESAGSNLVSDDTNFNRDIFVYDTQLKTTRRVSVASDGTESNNESEFSSISGDGRYVAYYSEASNLVSGDTNDQPDIFVYDTQLKTTRRLSVASDGTEANAATSYYYEPSISGDGRYVAYDSAASNLVSGDTNEKLDIFVSNNLSPTPTPTSTPTSGNDELKGDKEDNLIKGLEGSDKLIGKAGNDTLVGGPGKDRLTGNGGNDTFFFNRPDDKGDKITDFESKDVITVSNVSFEDLATDEFLNESQFVISRKATTESQRFIYQNNNGRLFYDSDGSGPQAKILIVTLQDKPELRADNIFVVDTQF